MLKKKLINNIPLLMILLTGSILHVSLFSLNDILKVADSFAYLQMSYFIKNFSIEGLGTGWFGFLYSLPIAIIDFFINNEILSAKIINITLFNIGAIFLYKIGKIYLNKNYNLLLIILFFLSPILLHFNIAILSENLYITLFLGLILFLHKYIKKITYKGSIIIGVIIGLLYLTRGEAFIYLGAIFVIGLILLIQKKVTLSKFIITGITILLSFTIFISPYIIHLNSITGEWGLTNKGSSNLRQAILRGQEKMDDEGFERAVAELTKDKHHLIAGFAGGLKYDKPSTDINLKSYFLEDPSRLIDTWIGNQLKLYTKNIPEIIIGDGIKSFYNDKSILYQNYIYIILVYTVLILTLYGFYKILKSNNNQLIIITLPFFIIASIFFTIFFTLNRYFVIFIPFFLIFILYGIQNIRGSNIYLKSLKIILTLNIVTIYLIGINNYYNEYKDSDNYREIKKEAGLYLNEKHNSKILNILERFPIVTYYSGTKNRWITPYTNKLSDIIEYANFNNIDYLVADTQDFKKYRPDIDYILDETKKYEGLEIEKIFEHGNEKVILYKIIK